MTTTDPLLLEGISRRPPESVRYEIINVSQIGTDDYEGVLDIDQSKAPSIRLDTTATIMRRLNGMHVDALAQAGVDELSDLIRPVWIMEGAREDQMGVFEFADASRGRYSYGLDLHATLTDRLATLDEELEAAVSYPVGTDPVAAAATLANDAGIENIVADPSPGSLSAPLAEPAGTNRLKVMDELLATVGFYRAHFNNAGQLRFRSVPFLPLATPDIEYGEGAGDTSGAVIDGSIVESNSLLSAPNRFLAIETGVSADEQPLVGIYDVPDSAPHSFVNRGRRVVKVDQFQGLPDQAAADAAAMGMEAQDSGAYEYVGFATFPVPTHDVFNVVGWRGTNYRELGWSLQLLPGADMPHDARRVYA